MFNIYEEEFEVSEQILAIKISIPLQEIIKSIELEKIIIVSQNIQINSKFKIKKGNRKVVMVSPLKLINFKIFTNQILFYNENNELKIQLTI